MKLKKDGTPDKRAYNGGSKNAGRKTKAEEMGLKSVLEKNMPFDELIQLIAEAARDGNWPAQKELLDRYVGKEAKVINQTTKHTGIDIAEILLNAYGNDKSDIQDTTDE